MGHLCCVLAAFWGDGCDLGWTLGAGWLGTDHWTGCAVEASKNPRRARWKHRSMRGTFQRTTAGPTDC